MKKQLVFEAAAREGVLRGAALLANAVRVTLGPKSKCVLIDRRFGEPIVCNDGVTIAKELEVEDPLENLGIRMIREAAERTSQAVGDGTTTATLLAHAIFADGVRNVAAGASAIELKRGLDRGVRVAVGALRTLSRPVRTRKEKVQVATISAHNDAAMGELVADAVERVGGEGVISVEEAKGTETTLDVVEGMQVDRGYLSPYFVTDPERMEAAFENPLVLLTDRRVSALNDVIPLLEQVVKVGRPFVVVADDVDGEALATLVVNKLRGALPCAALKAPGFGDRRKAILEDLGILTGGRVISQDVGTKLEHVALPDLGTARRVVVARENTTFIGGGGDRKAIDDRAEHLRKEIREAKSDYDREKLEERLGKLTGGVAVIRVGAPTEAELKSRKEAFEDAISATRAAIAEGIVPGAGLALLRAVDAISAEAARCKGDERTGISILEHALTIPTRQIGENSGEDGALIVERMRAGSASHGFDAARGEWVDLVEAGIVDPTKVVRLALENAVSVASVLLLTEAALVEIAERKSEPIPVEA